MTCEYTPQLDDVELMMTLDGEANPEVAMHVSQCPRCRRRARQLAGSLRIATARLFRATCPSALEMGEYHLNMLPGDEMATIRQHLAVCPHCAQELAQLTTFMDGPDPYLHPAPWAALQQQVRVLVARLTSAPQSAGVFGQLALSPALAGLRGVSAGPVTYEAGDAQIVLEVQKDGVETGHRTMIGLVMGLPNQGLRAHLWQDEREALAVAVDDFGNFSADNLAPGRYELFITGDRDEIHIQDLHI